MALSDSPAPLFRERLTPSAPVVVVGALLGASTGLIVWPFSPPLAAVVAVTVATAVVVALVVAAPLVVVDGGRVPSLRAGRAHIDVELLGSPEELDRDGLRAALGPGADARAFVCQRPWSDAAVRVPVLDASDPAPYWLVCTRRPRELAAALRAAAQAAHSEQTSWPPSS
ncbi:DUF3093 domain-containing protein [Georgenia wangjunii]|uniref:DUF3093 domain-containing protein n=1 Tax=Georgenia wangjunii TaxID=3117730 RepID=UPI002F26A14C